MYTIELTLIPITPATMPEPLKDVLVIWAPEGEEVERPEDFTHWSKQPALPVDLVAHTRPIPIRKVESHAH